MATPSIKVSSSGSGSQSNPYLNNLRRKDDAQNNPHKESTQNEFSHLVVDEDDPEEVLRNQRIHLRRMQTYMRYSQTASHLFISAIEHNLRKGRYHLLDIFLPNKHKNFQIRGVKIYTTAVQSVISYDAGSSETRKMYLLL